MQAVLTAAQQQRALDLLRRVIGTVTVNPPGGEEALARLLAEELEKAGLACQVGTFAPGRANILARLPGREPPRRTVVPRSNIVPRHVPPSGRALRKTGRKSAHAVGKALRGAAPCMISKGLHRLKESGNKAHFSHFDENFSRKNIDSTQELL